MIKKLMGMLDKQGKAASHKGKAAPKTAAAPAKKQRGAAVPTLGSWDMAKAAGNDFGTNVVHLYPVDVPGRHSRPWGKLARNPGTSDH